MTAVFDPGAGETCPETLMVALPTYVERLVWTVSEYEDAAAVPAIPRSRTMADTTIIALLMPYRVTSATALVEIGMYELVMAIVVTV